MSLTLIRPYFRAQVSAAGFTEWEDGFGDDNIPATILDRSFHQKIINVSGSGVNQETVEYLAIEEVKVYFKGFRDPSGAIDESLVASEAIIVKCLNIADYVLAGLKGVYFDNLTIEPYDQSENDNIIVATLTFNIRVFNCLV